MFAQMQAIAKHRFSFTHLLAAVGAILVVGTGANLAFLVLPALSELQQARHATQQAEAYEKTLHALQQLSAERGPANLVMSVEPGNEAALEKLGRYRAQTDAAIKRARAHLSQAGFEGKTGAFVTATVRATEKQLRKARKVVDAIAASPLKERTLPAMSQAINLMFEAFDALQPLVAVQQRNFIQSSDATASDSFMMAAAVTDLREFAGRLGSYIVPPVAHGVAVDEDRFARIQQVTGQIQQVLRSLPKSDALPSDTRMAKALAAVEDRYVAGGLVFMQQLAAAGRYGRRYPVTAAELTNRYVPTMVPLEDLRGLVFAQLIERFHAHEAHASLTMILAATIAGLTILVFSLLPLSLHHLVTRPMLTARRAIIMLSHDKQLAIDPDRSSIREIHDLFKAIGVLNGRMRERRDLMDELRDRTERDALTGLMSRSHFESCVEQASDQATGSSFGLLYLDIDNFKSINDSLGHQIGDKVLAEVGRCLGRFRSETVLIGRMGGDEFAICCTQASVRERDRLAASIVATIDSIDHVDGQAVPVSTSIGLSTGEPGPNSYPILCRQADLALYKAKAGGRNAYVWYSPDYDPDVRTETAIRRDLVEALERDEFMLHYQPIVDCATGAISAYEALLRWEHPEHGLISPLKFVTALEKTGRIVEAGSWVLRQGLKAARGWPAGIKLCVNVSPAQLDRVSFPLEVAAALAESELPAHRLCLEITETSPVAGNTQRHAVLNQLRSLGVRIALDDFGTAYAGMSALHNGLFDILKLDRSFAAGIGSCDRSQTVITQTLALARSLGLDCIIEGVETQAQFDWLAAQGCPHAQGYLLGRPLPLAELGNKLEKHAG